MYIISSNDLYESYSEDLLDEGIRSRLKVIFNRNKPKKSSSSSLRDLSSSNPKGLSKGSLFIRARQFAKEMEKKHGRGSQAHIEALARTDRLINSEFELWVNELINEGYDLSDYTWDDVYDLYEMYDDYNYLIDYILDENYVDDSDSAEEMILYMSEEWIDDILESKKWIQGAIKKPGALSKQLGVPESENIPRKMLTRAAKGKGKLGKRARLALTLRKFK